MTREHSKTITLTVAYDDEEEYEFFAAQVARLGYNTLAVVDVTSDDLLEPNRYTTGDRP